MTSAEDSHPATSRLSFTTSHIPSRDRIEYWEAHNAKALIGLDIRTLEDAVLTAEEINLQLPKLRFAGVRGSSQIVERSQRLISEYPTGDIAVFFAIRGEAFFYHSKGTLFLRPGQAVIYDADRPFVRGFTAGLYELVLTIPRDDFTHLTGGVQLPEPQVVDFATRSGAPCANPTATALASLIDTALRTPPDDLARIEEESLELVDRMVSRTHDADRDASYRRAVREIESRFGERSLDRSDVASAVGVSERQLSRLFAARDETFASHLQRHRVGTAEKLLESEPHTTVAEVARRCGFSSPSHFSQVFKAHAGMTPLELRRSVER